jgi:hypothetical protein
VLSNYSIYYPGITSGVFVHIGKRDMDDDEWKEDVYKLWIAIALMVGSAIAIWFLIFTHGG